MTQLYTKSTDWYDDGAGWKSTQGGFSAVSTVSTDENNMGGFFVRKAAGAAAMGFHLLKLWPFLYHTNGTVWPLAHYTPLLWMGVLGNICLTAFTASAVPEWQYEQNDNLVHFAYLLMAVLTTETIVLAYFAVTCKTVKHNTAFALQDGKTPKSLPSNIVSRTVLLVSGAMAVLAARDLFAPGTILEFWPRDDVYLEWTNALRHSPPVGSPEYAAYGLDAPLYAGDKFMGQWLAVHLLVLSFVKIISACMIRIGADGQRGVLQAKLIWQGAALANLAMMFVVRVFSSAALSASLDLRYHLMAIGYETFILGLYGFF